MPLHVASKVLLYNHKDRYSKVKHNLWIFYF